MSDTGYSNMKGWETFEHEGRLWYFHPATETSQWERPLQDGWEAFEHEGRLWYFHTATETSQWERPTEDTAASCAVIDSVSRTAHFTAEQARCHICGIASQERRCEGCENKVCDACSHREWGQCIYCGILATIAE